MLFNLAQHRQHRRLTGTLELIWAIFHHIKNAHIIAAYGLCNTRVKAVWVVFIRPKPPLCWPSYFSLLGPKVQRSHDCLWRSTSVEKWAVKGSTSNIGWWQKQIACTVTWQAASSHRADISHFSQLHGSTYFCHQQKSRSQVMRSEVLGFYTRTAMIFMKWKSASTTESPSHDEECSALRGPAAHVKHSHPHQSSFRVA